MSQTKSNETVLELRGITKTFPGGVVANDKVDFDIKEGEIHALLGENGAGKSTLMNILFGLYKPDEGDIFIRGKRVDIRSPRDARRHGLGMVHQKLKLSDKMTVYENIILGNEPTNKGILEVNKAKEDIAELSELYNLKIDPDSKVGDLSKGEKQKVELMKALYHGAEILIMDEPTAPLTPQDKREFLRLTKEMAEEGKAVIPYITHKLDEVFQLSGRVTILSDGRVVGTYRTEDCTKEMLAKKMVGRGEVFQIDYISTEPGEKVLELKNVRVKDDMGGVALKDISLSVREGEILGLAGVIGNGQKELSEVLTGMRKVTGGDIYLCGEKVTNQPPKVFLEKGLGHVPEEPETQGIVLEYTLNENLFLGMVDKSDCLKSGPLPGKWRWLIDSGKVREETECLMDEFNIKAPNSDSRAGYLSGGNLQRLILAKVLSQSPKFILTDKPTKGLDVGSQEYIRKRLLKEKENGRAILLISEDLDELLQVSDRIAVIYEGEIMDIVPRDEAEREKIGVLMAGERPSE